MREFTPFCDLRELASRLANLFGFPSPYTSSGFANLRRLVSTCESADWPGFGKELFAYFCLILRRVCVCVRACVRACSDSFKKKSHAQHLGCARDASNL